jgi:DNA-binding protein
MNKENEVNQPSEKGEDKPNVINAKEDEPKEIKKENLENLSNEIRVNSKSSISSLLELCGRMLSFKKDKELQMSASGKSISKLIALVEIVKSMHPYLIQNTTLTTTKAGEEADIDERGKLTPKIEIVLSEREPQGKSDVKLNEEEKKKLLDIWESQKERENKIQRSPVVNNNGNGFQNNYRNGFVKKWGYGFGNNGRRWQGNYYGNNRRMNWRNNNRNWNYVNNRGMWFHN